MIVEPSFFGHWKTRMLEAKLGESAPLYILRLWAHCQTQRQWIFDGIPEEGIAAICGFYGDPEALVEALVKCKFIGRDEGQFTVLHWDEYNSILVRNWNNGAMRKQKGKTPSKPSQCEPNTKPDGSQCEASANPTQSQTEASAKPVRTQNQVWVGQCEAIRLDKIRKKENSPTESKRKKSVATPRAVFRDWWETAGNSLMYNPDWPVGARRLWELAKKQNDHFDMEALLTAMDDFLAAREAQKHPVTQRALELMVADMLKCPSVKVIIALLQDATKNGTRGWYWEDKAARFASQQTPAACVGSAPRLARNGILSLDDDDEPASRFIAK